MTIRIRLKKSQDVGKVYVSHINHNKIFEVRGEFGLVYEHFAYLPKQNYPKISEQINS